ncbi:MAG: HD domain-containing protein [Tissierellales bacterium]|nr:HD domain-containing protein [Tissierellales bacterium]MBN2826540.1 HD domain-containing protein [Tissierellales bacterium]
MKYADTKFMKIAGPLINNKEFQKMKTIKHHDESVYDHVVDVAYHSYKMAYKRGLDWESTIRGALLHDFYLYKFDKTPRVRLPYDALKHMIHHPIIALENATRLFELNRKEKDIIVSHMFPARIPKFKESWIVSYVDKYLAVYEYYLNFRKLTSKKYREAYQRAQ